MKTPKRIRQLERMATNMVADGKDPNLFFVTIKGVVVTVTRSFQIAYDQWKNLTGFECMLEDRKWGMICGSWPAKNNLRAVVTDLSEGYKKRFNLT